MVTSQTKKNMPKKPASEPPMPPSVAATEPEPPPTGRGKGASRKRKNDPPTPEPEPPPPIPPAAPKRQKKKPASEVSSVAPASEVSSVAPVSEVSSVAPASEVSTVATTATTTSRKTKDKKRKRNKRTPSSYVLFSMNHRKTVLEANPDLTLGEVSKLCGAAWKVLSEEARKLWVDKATELRQKRQDELAEEKANEPVRKKRTPSSYLLFAMEHRKVILEGDPSLAIGAVSKACGAKWKEMPDTEKKVWKDKADALKVSGV